MLNKVVFFTVLTWSIISIALLVEQYTTPRIDLYTVRGFHWDCTDDNKNYTTNNLKGLSLDKNEQLIYDLVEGNITKCVLDRIYDEF